jgi:hypothetical protein
MKRLVFVTALVALLLGIAVIPAFAAVSVPSSGSLVNAAGIPTGSKLVINITYKVTNDEDSGNVGYWALDNYNKLLQVWSVPDGSFYAVAKYNGKWHTFEGALSPGAGVVEGNDATGTFHGGYRATFQATSCSRTFGNVGSYDFGGTKADILLGTYGAGQTGSTTPFNALSTYCPGYDGATFNYINWGWSYRYRSQAWFNFMSGTTGDIVVP